MFQTSGHLDLFKARRLKTKEHALPSRSWPPCGDTSRRWGYQLFWITSFVKIFPQRVICVTAQLPSANTRKNAAHPKRRRWGDSPMKSYQAFLGLTRFHHFFLVQKEATTNFRAAAAKKQTIVSIVSLQTCHLFQSCLSLKHICLSLFNWDRKWDQRSNRKMELHLSFIHACIKNHMITVYLICYWKTNDQIRRYTNY